MVNSPPFNDTTIDYIKSKRAYRILHALNHPIRQDIVQLLEKNTRLNVTDIQVSLRLEQSATSQFLAVLRNANIVKSERQSKSKCYSLNRRLISRIQSVLSELPLAAIGEKP